MNYALRIDINQGWFQEGEVDSLGTIFFICINTFQLASLFQTAT